MVMMYCGSEAIESRIVTAKILQIRGYLTELMRDMVDQNEDFNALTKKQPAFRINYFLAAPNSLN